MNNIEEIWNKLVFFKLLTNSECGDLENSITVPNSRVSRAEFGYKETGENTANSVTNLPQNPKAHNLNNVNSHCQTEPLDLSQKQNSIVKTFSNVPLPKRMWKPKAYDFDAFFSVFIKRFTANDVCYSRCHMLYKDHYHCFAENGNCNDVLKGKDQLRQHGKRHTIAEEVTKLEFKMCHGCESSDDKIHYHCSYYNCEYMSSDISNMSRLEHVETNHCIIISKRTNSHFNAEKQFFTGKKRKRVQTNVPSNSVTIKELPVVEILMPLSPISSGSSDNQFVDFNPDSIINTINNNSCLSILDHLSPDRDHIINDNVVDHRGTKSLLTVKEDEKNFFPNGSCYRLFCNLKKGDHYHCPICDRGSSKLELYVRHLKQRHK